MLPSSEQLSSTWLLSRSAHLCILSDLYKHPSTVLSQSSDVDDSHFISTNNLHILLLLWLLLLFLKVHLCWQKTTAPLSASFEGHWSRRWQQQLWRHSATPARTRATEHLWPADDQQPCSHLVILERKLTILPHKGVAHGGGCLNSHEQTQESFGDSKHEETVINRCRHRIS